MPGMAGCMIRNPDGSEQRSARRRIPDPWIELTRFLHLERFFPQLTRNERLDLIDDPVPEGPVPVAAVSGAFMLVRRTALDEVGPLNEGYFLHCEDLDWFVRFRRAGWKLYLVPDVTVVHHQGSCSTGRPIAVEWHKHSVDREPVVGHGQEGTGRRIADGRLNRFDPYREHGQKHELVDRYLDTELTAGPLQPGAQAGDPPGRQVGLEFRDPARIQGRPNRPFASEVGLVPGVTASLKSTLGPLSLVGEWNGAIGTATFTDDARSRISISPGAWQVSLGYQLDWNPWMEAIGAHGTYLAMSYSESRDFSGVRRDLDGDAHGSVSCPNGDS